MWSIFLKTVTSGFYGEHSISSPHHSIASPQHSIADPLPLRTFELLLRIFELSLRIREIPLYIWASIAYIWDSIACMCASFHCVSSTLTTTLTLTLTLTLTTTLTQTPIRNGSSGRRNGHKFQIKYTQWIGHKFQIKYTQWNAKKETQWKYMQCTIQRILLETLQSTIIFFLRFETCQRYDEKTTESKIGFWNSI